VKKVLTGVTGFRQYSGMTGSEVWTLADWRLLMSVVLAVVSGCNALGCAAVPQVGKGPFGEGSPGFGDVGPGAHVYLANLSNGALTTFFVVAGLLIAGVVWLLYRSRPVAVLKE